MRALSTFLATAVALCVAACSGQQYRSRSSIASDLVAGGNRQKMTDALSAAASSGWIDLMERALDAGADPNGRSSDGYKPIVYAISNNHVDAAKILLSHGADASGVREPSAEFNNKSAIEYSDLMGHSRMAGFLRDATAPKPDARPAASPPTEKRSIGSDIDTPARRGAERPDDFALVIGIEDYQSLPKADYGARDAQTVRRHFEALGLPARNIISLEGPQATGSKLRSYLQQWLPRNVKPESTVFVYYSGHGAPDPAGGDAYLVPWDADPMFLTTTAYPLRQFYTELSALKAKRVLVAVDACFSGSGGHSVLAKGARPLVAKINESVPAAANLTVLAAASGTEITGSLDEQAHGIFTYHLLKALSGGAKTPRALFDYLKPRVQDDARRQNREQSPTLAGSDADAAF